MVKKLLPEKQRYIWNQTLLESLQKLVRIPEKHPCLNEIRKFIQEVEKDVYERYFLSSGLIVYQSVMVESIINAMKEGRIGKLVQTYTHQWNDVIESYQPLEDIQSVYHQLLNIEQNVLYGSEETNVALHESKESIVSNDANDYEEVVFIPPKIVSKYLPVSASGTAYETVCRQCKSTNIIFETEQKRGADESFTVKYTCCNHKCKFQWQKGS